MSIVSRNDFIRHAKPRAHLPQWALLAGEESEVVKRLQEGERPIRRGADIKRLPTR